jgi:hypothetical protein
VDPRPRYIWRNMLFRNLGAGLSSALIWDALSVTYREWAQRYGALPVETLRTEIGIDAVKSSNPGYCYKVAGFHSGRVVRGKLYLDAPCPTWVATGDCACCPKDDLLSIARSCR